MPNKEGRSVAPRDADAVVVSVRIPRALHARIGEIAAADQRSVSWMTRRLIETAIDALDKHSQ